MRQSLVLQVTGPAILITDALSGTQGGTQGLFQESSRSLPGVFQESSRSLPVFVFLKCQPFSLLVSLVARCPRILNVLICPSRSKGCYPIHHGSQRYIFPRRQLDAFLPLSNPHCDTQSTSCIGSMLPYVAICCHLAVFRGQSTGMFNTWYELWSFRALTEEVTANISPDLHKVYSDANNDTFNIPKWNFVNWIPTLEIHGNTVYCI